MGSLDLSVNIPLYIALTDSGQRQISVKIRLVPHCVWSHTATVDWPTLWNSPICGREQRNVSYYDMDNNMTPPITFFPSPLTLWHRNRPWYIYKQMEGTGSSGAHFCIYITSAGHQKSNLRGLWIHLMGHDIYWVEKRWTELNKLVQ